MKKLASARNCVLTPEFEVANDPRLVNRAVYQLVNDCLSRHVQGGVNRVHQVCSNESQHCILGGRNAVFHCIAIRFSRLRSARAY